MQSFSAAPSDRRPRLLVVELWGVGDVALALPFLQRAAARHRVTLLAKPHAAPLVQRFCPEVELLPCSAPWTVHRGKYRLHQWPWRGLAALVGTLRSHRFAAAVSVRPDPRDHFLMALTGAKTRAGFPRAGSGLLLNAPVPPSVDPHRAAYWSALAAALDLPALPPATPAPRPGRRLVIHTGAAQPTREWPRERFAALAQRLVAAGWEVTLLDASSGSLPELLATLASADRFIGNDSGPGHLAAGLGVPTFSIFGAQLAANFHPVHPQAAWIDGRPCPFKPCHDYCRFAEPRCIRDLPLDEVWPRVERWLAGASA